MAKKTEISSDPFKNFEFPSEEQIKNDTLSEKAKLRYSDPNYKKKHRQSLEKIYSNPEWQKRMQELGQDPKINELRRKASIAIWEDEEKVKQISKNRKATMATEEYQEKMEKVYNDPNWRKKVKAGGRTQCKSFTTPDGVFEALADAAKHHDITPQSMRERSKTQPHLYYYTDIGPGKEIIKPKPKKKKYIRKVYTPDGVFDNLKDASIFYKVHPDTIKYRIKTHDNYSREEKSED